MIKCQIEEIGIYTNNFSSANGPGKVCQNLIKGLDKLGVKCQINANLKDTGFLNGYVSPTIQPNMLLGPNIFVLPSDLHPDFWKTKRNLVTPSDWVRDKYVSQLGPEHNVFVWPVGIDTEWFTPSKLDKTNDCLIYFKRGSESKRLELIDYLNSKDMTYREIVYGQYSEEMLIETARSSRFCVTLTSTESQGIAYQEILSMGLPMYVVDKQVWDDRPGVCFPATSAPYFDDRCGIKHPDLSRLEEFLDNLNEFQPREYILGNLTLEKCAFEYLSLLEKCRES